MSFAHMAASSSRSQLAVADSIDFFLLCTKEKEGVHRWWRLMGVFEKIYVVFYVKYFSLVVVD